ncbi:MAG: tetratricopeptide repeat protein, partial [Chloroflexi bacterium]|nr:tetratricopeptide repeat protein [Chloroflexota bacterium]
EEALADYDRSLQLRPDDPAALYNRGNTLGDLGRHAEAVASYDRAIQVDPRNASALSNRGLTLIRLAPPRSEDALTDLDRALELRPKYARTLYHRARAYSLLNRVNESLADLRYAIESDPARREQAYDDSDFDNIRDDPRFQELVGEDETPAEGGANS